jgi:hypothetical protein
VIKTHSPAFTIGKELSTSKRVYKHEPNQFLGLETPGVGRYNPFTGSIKDKLILEQTRTQRSILLNQDKIMRMSLASS